jgi:hypothetical protein
MIPGNSITSATAATWMTMKSPMPLKIAFMSQSFTTCFR